MTPQSAETITPSDKSASGEGEVIEIIHADVKSSNLNALRVRGGNKLKGEIPISGAKNAALKHMCAALLTDQPVQFTNMPVTLGDVRTLSELLNYLGMTVALRSDGVAMLKTPEIKTHVAPYDLVRKMRASVLVLGPLLARDGQADISMPGGCAIGTRPIDLHLMGFEAMGAKIELDGGYVKARAPKGLKGAHITFPFVSVGATENVMMAATLAEGETVLSNAAREPEIIDQGKALISMGAKIEGLGTTEIRIQGVSSLGATTHSCIPDRIETGTYMCAVGLAGGEVRLKNTRTDFLSSLIGPLTGAGMEIKQDGDDVYVYRNGSHLKGIDIMTEPYPGFATDLQAQFMAMLTLCKGAGMVTETVFENRFMHVPELCRMGADITVQGNSAIVRGVEKLKGAEVMATDLRASVALVLAGLVAEGETVVNRIYHLDRGYENIVDKLTNVGADIERVSGR
ncbi:MAG TPA: UDP-N-acetylglucosamine 1-carboxyvinyltransferase [Micavibrio sp.]|nr:UDP-N-acetylglucosamine 1-carboxyvinyltransferase [Micavibrio sp.]